MRLIEWSEGISKTEDGDIIITPYGKFGRGYPYNQETWMSLKPALGIVRMTERFVAVAIFTTFAASTILNIRKIEVLESEVIALILCALTKFIVIRFFLRSLKPLRISSSFREDIFRQNFIFPPSVLKAVKWAAILSEIPLLQRVIGDLATGDNAALAATYCVIVDYITIYFLSYVNARLNQ